MKKYGLEGDGHWVRQDIAIFEKRNRANPKQFPTIQERVFQRRYAPIFHRSVDGSIGCSPMRYGAYEPSFINPKIGGAFNARRDNLHAPYWSEAFGIHHGFALVSGFFEKVLVKDVIKAGSIELEKIQIEYDLYYSQRKEKILAAGKRFRPTENELKDVLERQIAIQFRADDDSILIVPVVFTERILEDGMIDRGCAVVTGEPQDEVDAAGHDRSPIFITREAIMDWIEIDGKTSDDFQEILDRKPHKVFQHQFSSVI